MNSIYRWLVTFGVLIVSIEVMLMINVLAWTIVICRMKRSRPCVYAAGLRSLAVTVRAVIAVLTRCSTPHGLQQLQEKHGLPALPSLEVAVVRSRASAGFGAVDALHGEVIRTLQRPAI